MTDLSQYAEIAKRQANANDPAGLTEYLLEISGAISSVSELTMGLEAVMLRKEREYRDQVMAAEPGASEARIGAAVQALTVEERIAVKQAESLLKALHLRFKAVQSALSYRKAEMRI